MSVPDPGDDWRLVDVTMEGPLPGAQFWCGVSGKWIDRVNYRLPYSHGLTYRVPQDRVWVSPSVLGLPNIPAPDFGDHEPESYQDRVASSRMLGITLFGCLCFLSGVVASWMGSLLCSWLWS